MGAATSSSAWKPAARTGHLDQVTWYTAAIHGDAPTTALETNPDKVEINRVLVKSSDSLVARMAAGGGQAGRAFGVLAGDGRQRRSMMWASGRGTGVTGAGVAGGQSW